MKKIYIFTGIACFVLAVGFAYLANVFSRVYVMAPAEYARQAQEIVCEQTTAGKCAAHLKR